MSLSSAQIGPALTNERRLTGLAYACLLIVGIHSGWIGPFISEISRTLQLPIDRAGLVVSAASAGYFVALIGAGGVSHRWSAQKILVLAMALLGAGMFGLAIARGFPALLSASVLLGLGNGSIDVAANALIVDLNRDRLAAALNYLHVLFGVGAMMGPMVASFALANAIPYWWVFSGGAAASSIVAIGLATTAAVEVRVPVAPGDGFVSLLERPLIWVIGGVLFLYVGAEMGIGEWLTLYLHAAAALSVTIASAGVSLYWLGLVLGRIAGGRLADRIAPRELSILASVLSAVALIGLIAAPRSHALAALMVMLIGFGYGPIFPNMVAVGAARFPTQVGRMSSIVIGGGALGGIAVPWIMGHAMADATPRLSMELALAVTALMALLSFAVRGSGSTRPAG